MASVSIKNFTRRRTVPRVLFSKIAKDVLPLWDISLVFVGSTRALALNKKLRRKNYVSNVLSYIVGEKNGEIFICLQEAEKQAPLHGMNERTFVLSLFIHGLLHIKGWAHGATMERCEQKLLAKFAKRVMRTNAHGETNSDRHRYRHVPDKNGRRRGAHR